MFLFVCLSAITCGAQYELGDNEKFPPLDKGQEVIATWLARAINMPSVSDSVIGSEGFFLADDVIYTQANESYFDEDALLFGNLLNIPVASTSLIWTSPLFSGGDLIATNGFKFVNQDMNLVISSNEQTVACGQLHEKTTYKDARSAIIFSLIMNNMFVEANAGCYHSHTNSIGDFILVENTLLPTGEVTTNGFSVVHFVRGAKAISLYGKDGADVQAIAEMLDALLKQPPIIQ